MNKSLQLPEYAIYTGPIGQTLPAWLQERQYSKIFLITDCNTHVYCRALLPTLPLTEFIVGAKLPLGSAAEPLKTLAGCEAIWSAMLAAQLDRKALVINLGGGVISDMGGFCAATYKRGVDFIQIPTTLLAMTDAAIGGKLGIDFRGIKNTIGVFRNPVAVFVDPVFLHTLPPRELRSGFAEVIKHALIGDQNLWKKIQGLPAAAFSTAEKWNPSAWLDLLEASIAVKTRIVSADPFETGIRALLNFGHTFGHALESYFLNTDTPLTHGEAIAIGMLCEADIPELAPVIFRVFGSRHIPVSAFPDLWELMQQDKKNASGRVRMALPDAKIFSMKMENLSRSTLEQRLQAYNQLSTNFSA